MTAIDRAVIPAAGWGTRFLPATKETPKEMLSVIDTPALLYVVNEAIDSGIEFIHIVTSRNKTSMENFFRRNRELEHVLIAKGMMDEAKMVEKIGSYDERNIRFVTQNEQKGLGHSIYCATKKHDSLRERPFAVLLGDDIIISEKPCTRQLMEVSDKYDCSVVAVQSVTTENAPKYGIITGEQISSASNGHPVYKMTGMVEKPKKNAPSINGKHLAAMGRYILEPQIHSILKEMVDKNQKGSGGELQLTDAIVQLPQEYKTRNLAYEFDGRRYDLGDKFDYVRATVEIGLGRPDIGPQLRRYLKELNVTE